MISMISLKNISKLYGESSTTVAALKNINLEIQQGEFVAIVGTSGSGKTTLLHLLGTLDAPTSGEYILNNERMDTLDDINLSARRNTLIGFVFQHFNLLPRCTAIENVLTPGLYSNNPPQESDAIRVMEKVGIAHRKTHFPSEMSGGEQQRVAIARSLIMNPKLLLADEPTGNLDSTTSKQIIDLFRSLNKEGLTILLVTHDPKVAESADRVITVKDGNVVSDTRSNSVSTSSVAIADRIEPATVEV